MSIILKDDGTLDSVAVCTECHKEFRGTFSDSGYDSYDSYIEWFIEDIENEHIPCDVIKDESCRGGSNRIPHTMGKLTGL